MSGSSISWAICKSAPRSKTDNHASTPPLSFLQAGCPSCRPTNSVKALKLKIVTNEMIVFARDMNGHIGSSKVGYDGTLGGFGYSMARFLSGRPTSLRVLPTIHHFHPSLSPVVSLSLVILHEWMRTQMLAKPSSNLLQRTGGDHQGGRTQPG